MLDRVTEDDKHGRRRRSGESVDRNLRKQRPDLAVLRRRGSQFGFSCCQLRFELLRANLSLCPALRDLIGLVLHSHDLGGDLLGGQGRACHSD